MQHLMRDALLADIALPRESRAAAAPTWRPPLPAIPREEPLFRHICSPPRPDSARGHALRARVMSLPTLRRARTAGAMATRKSGIGDFLERAPKPCATGPVAPVAHASLPIPRAHGR